MCELQCFGPFAQLHPFPLSVHSPQPWKTRLCTNQRPRSLKDTSGATWRLQSSRVLRWRSAVSSSVMTISSDRVCMEQHTWRTGSRSWSASPPRMPHARHYSRSTWNSTKSQRLGHCPGRAMWVLEVVFFSLTWGNLASNTKILCRHGETTGFPDANGYPKGPGITWNWSFGVSLGPCNLFDQWAGWILDTTRVLPRYDIT